MYVINKDEDQWWTVRHESGRTGQVPVPYIQVVSEGSTVQADTQQSEVSLECHELANLF